MTAIYESSEHDWAMRWAGISKAFSLNLTAMGNNLRCIFQKAQVEKIARQTGFLQRKSKINPLLFIDLMFRMVSQHCSLEKLRSEALMEHSVSVSKQGLDKRFSKAGISFCKRLLSVALSQQIELSVPPFAVVC